MQNSACLGTGARATAQTAEVVATLSVCPIVSHCLFEQNLPSTTCLTAGSLPAEQAEAVEDHRGSQEEAVSEAVGPTHGLLKHLHEAVSVLACCFL